MNARIHFSVNGHPLEIDVLERAASIAARLTA
jgi:hypothetical protein